MHGQIAGPDCTYTGTKASVALRRRLTPHPVMTRGALCVVCTIALSAVALTTELEVTHVDLVPHFNNKATAPFGQLAGFNDGKEAYPVDYLPSGIFTDDGFTACLFLIHSKRLSDESDSITYQTSTLLQLTMSTAPLKSLPYRRVDISRQDGRVLRTDIMQPSTLK